MTTGKQEAPKANHPWRSAYNKLVTLKKAKKIGLRRYQRKWQKDHYDELTRNLHRDRNRKKKGIDVSMPLMKPWDYVKGRAGNLDFRNRKAV